MPKSKRNRKRAPKSKDNGSHREVSRSRRADGSYHDLSQQAASLIARVDSRRCPEWSKFKRIGSSSRDFSAETLAGNEHKQGFA